MQKNDSGVNGGDWEDSPATPSLADGQNVVSLGATNPAAFFRLRKP